MNDQIQQEQTQQTSTAPVGQLKTNKSLVKFILLSLITFGIYGIVILSSVSNDINIIASRYDEKEQCITACFASLSETSRSVSDILFGITKYPTESEPNLTEEA